MIRQNRDDDFEFDFFDEESQVSNDSQLQAQCITHEQTIRSLQKMLEVRTEQIMDERRKRELAELELAAYKLDKLAAYKLDNNVKPSEKTGFFADLKKGLKRG